MAAAGTYGSLERANWYLIGRTALIPVRPAQDQKISQLIAQAKFVVGLEFATMAVSADTLKVFPTVWIASLQSPDEPRRHNVVHVAARIEDLRRCFLDFPL